MASTQLSDEEIFSELKRFGFTPGPVTENTRPVYLKKLKKLREEQQQRGSRSSKTRSSGSINSTAGDGSTAASRPVSPDVTHLSSSRRPGRKSSVLGFSSDESDAETPLRRKGLEHSSKANRSSGFQKQQKVRPLPTHNAAIKVQYGGGTRLNSNFSPGSDGQRSVSLGWGVGARSSLDSEGMHYDESADDDDCEDETEKNSCSLNGRGGSRLNNNKLVGEYSDSDEEEVGGFGAGERERDGLEFRRGHRIVPFASHVVERSSQTEEKNSEVKPLGGVNMVKSRGEVEAEDEAKRRDLDPSGGSRSNRVPRKSIYLSLAENHGGKAGENNHVDSEDGTSRSNSTSRFSIGLRPRFSNYSSLSQTFRDNHSNHTPAPNHSYSQAVLKKKLSVPEDELLQQFKREELASSSSFSAHYLSMFLLTAACLFFLLLGLMYLRMRGTGSSEMDGTIKSHPFGSDFDSSYNKGEKDVILKLLLNLHDHLAFIAGQHDCGDQQHPNRSLSMDEASAYLLTQNKEFEGFIHTSLEWIIRTGQDLGIRLTGQVADDPVTEVSEISRLESTHPKMPFQCRFRRAFLTVIVRVLLIAAVVGCVWSVVCYMRYRWRKEEEETRHMYDMVERIIDVLKTHGEAYQENQDLQAYLPIPHVRDSLVQPQDRKTMKKIWDRAVNFLSANESRIRTETQRIGGADFLVWRWIQPSLSCDKTSLMPSKVWQGKAFPLDRRNSPPNSLTPCLKIRNMFDPVMEVGENWDLAIHEAILEKCSDNDGIVHIAVDKNSREGCVYVKCLSAEHSGKAFKALHGSWFDGKLVTVKYLRLDRYHQRFPQAQGCSTPLKASSLHMSSPMNTARLQYYGSANSSGFS
ncbi:inner nuclear membrane protein Man1 [Stegastes partitus]|uniref:Inner nuclear membrane protein Man1 n=1 Tax=Stegastes partitus TaxID=144197 RepID=A0A3B4ZU09_9TELE|nr:PREDICTED: inner nuclear membrane protein Man1 [Stegastes partitus]